MGKREKLPMTRREPTLMGWLQPPIGGLGLFLTGKCPDGHPEADDATGPLVRIFTAFLGTTEGQTIHAVQLAAQPDQYPAIKSELLPVTNPEIDNLWMMALERHAAGGSEGLPLSPACQKSPQGQWTPFRSLFYCSHTRRFAHALCPDCGEGLSVCRDNTLLSQAGLPTYDGSIERFLYCSKCSATHSESAFYTCGAADRQSTRLKNGGGLLAEWSKLLKKRDLAAELPCIDCPEAARCYGSEKMVTTRMRPIFFYPSYALIQPRANISASVLQAILSGAAPAEMREPEAPISNLPDDPTGGFLFSESDPRRFLETLYLKLTFLHDLAKILTTQPDQANEIADRMTLGGLSVALPHSSGRLPFLWNFRLMLADPIGSPYRNPSLERKHRHQWCYFLSGALFYLLLNNSRRPFKMIHDALERLAGDSHLTSLAELTAETGMLFTPDNNFWRGNPMTILKESEAIWYQALDFGLRLRRSVRRPTEMVSDEQLEQDLEQMRGSIHRLLFAGHAVVAGIKPEETHNKVDQAIAAIVRGVLEKWPSIEPRRGQIEQVALQESEEDIVEETVILERTDTTKRSAQPHQPINPAETVASSVSVLKESTRVEADLEATVMIQPAHPGAAADHDLAATVIVESPNDVNQREDLAETVMMGKPSAGKRDDLEQTILIKPGQENSQELADPRNPFETQRSGNTTRDDLDLEATIVMKPQIPTPRKPR